MKHSHGILATTAIPILALASVAAVGWYYYYSEVEINQSQTMDSRTQQELFNNKLADRQARIDKLLQDETDLQASLTAEKKSQGELAAALEKTRAEKMAVESSLQRELADLNSTTAGLEADFEEQQTTISRLRENEIMLQARLASEKDSRQELQARLASEKDSRQELQARLASEKESRQALQARLATGKESQEELAARLEKTVADKMVMESNLKGEVYRVNLTTAELEAELENRRVMQESLHDEINTIIGEKSQLLRQLEQEQESNKQIANLKTRLEQELNESRVEISQLKNQVTVIKLTSEVLFSTGSAKIKPAGEKVLSIIADSLNAYPLRAVSVEGHTDDIPIRNAYFKSNWELSTARGLAAVEFFQRNADVDPKRLKVVGYGQYHPVSSNESAEGRQLNRRIEIRILPPQ